MSESLGFWKVPFLSKYSQTQHLLCASRLLSVNGNFRCLCRLLRRERREVFSWTEMGLQEGAGECVSVCARARACVQRV